MTTKTDYTDADKPAERNNSSISPTDRRTNSSAVPLECRGFLGDERGVSNVIGAILAVALIGILYATAVATVPSQIQADTEFDHSRESLADLQNLHARIMDSATAGTTQQSVVQLGGRYPTYLIFPQPGGPSSSLYLSSKTYTVEIRNAEAVDGDVARYIDGSPLSFTTRNLRLQPQYREYNNAPEPVITGGGMVEEYRDRHVVVSQSESVSGRQLQLNFLRGEFNQGGTGALRVESEYLSESRDTVQVTNVDSANHIQVRIETELPLSVWKRMLASEIDDDTNIGQPTDNDGQYIAAVTMDTTSDPNQVVMHLEEDANYQLGMSALGVTAADQPQVSESKRPSAMYLSRKTINEPVVAEERSIELTVKLRDELNNQVKDVLVEASPEQGTIRTGRKVTKRDGTVTFVYTAPEISDSIADVSSRSYNVDVTIVGESGSLYTVTFTVHVQNIY